jgi:hypothetical protein
MSLNLWNQHLARISLRWWSTPNTIHTFTLCKPQIMWFVSKSQSTSIHVYQINVESEINVLHIKSPFRCSTHALIMQLRVKLSSKFYPPPIKLSTWILTSKLKKQTESRNLEAMQGRTCKHEVPLYAVNSDVMHTCMSEPNDVHLHDW